MSSETPVVSTVTATTGWGRRHTVVAMTFLAAFIAYTDRVNIAVAAVQMRVDLGWSQTQKGLVLSSFFVGYMLFMFASGWLANRFGGKRVLGFAVLAWSVFTLLTPLAASISMPALILARCVPGLAVEVGLARCLDQLRSTATGVGDWLSG